MDSISAENQYNDFTVHKVDPNLIVKPRKVFVNREPMNVKDTFWPGKKKLIPDYSRMEELDKFAKEAPDKLQLNPQELVEYLIQPAKNDLERYRLIFRWQANKIITGRRSNPKVTNAFQAIKAGESGRSVAPAMVFHELCSMVDLPCEVIKGYVKDPAHYPGKEGKFSWYCWNVVRIEEEEYLCDPLQACERYDQSDRGGRKLLQTPFDELSFIADPKGFSNVHLPYDGDIIGTHPGTEAVKSVDAWNNIVTRGLISSTLGTKLYSTEGIIATVTNLVNIKFWFSRDVILNHTLTEANDKESYDAHVIQVVRYEHVEFVIHLPHAGKFIFSVYGQAGNIQQNVSWNISGLIAKYCIVGKGTETHQPFPFTKCPYGFQTSAVMAGFDCINYPPIIETSECKITLEISRPVGGNISFHLFHESRPELKIIDMVYIEPFPKKFALHMALSYEGAYNLILFANHEGRKNVHTTCASFLIYNRSSRRASYFADPYSWGMHSHDHPVKCVDNCGSTIHAPCGESSITFTSPRNRGEEIDFKLYSPGKRGTWKEVTGFREWVFAEYIDSEEKLRTVKIDFRIPLKGFFQFILFYDTKSVGRWLISCPKGFEGPLYPEREGLWGPDCKMTEELKIKCSHPARFNALNGKAEFTVTVPQDMSKWHVFASLNDTAGPKLIMEQKDDLLGGNGLSQESSKVYTFYIDLPDSVSTAILMVHIGQEKFTGQKTIHTRNHGYWLVTATKK